MNIWYKSWESLVTLQLPSCRPLKLPSVASFSEQMNLKNKILLLFVQTYQKKKEVLFMEMSRDNDQKRKESLYMGMSCGNDHKKCVYK